MSGGGPPRLLALTLALAAGIPTAVDPPTPEAGTPIPPGAVKIELPDVRQPDGYSCGASAMMAVCAYYGVGPRTIAEFKAELRTDPDRGTDYREMVRLARSLGLDARPSVGLTLERLEAAVSGGNPVLVAIQAHADDAEDYRDPRSNGSGHYVVVIGFDATNLYLEDPILSGRRGSLPREEFLRRWHDDEGTPAHPRPVGRLGLEFGPGRIRGHRRDSPCAGHAAIP